MILGNIIYVTVLFSLRNAGVRAEYSNCTTGNVSAIQNGWCDAENNINECLYDGGDCCSCTCVRGLYYDCGSNGFTCVDPDTITGLQSSFICENSSSVYTTCAAEYQGEWIVENSTQARALAEAVHCSGGSFNVTWKGNVAVDKTISISNGTFLNVTSGDADTAIAGDGNIRLFEVLNASLHVSNITMNNGVADCGGAIFASRSSLILNRVIFNDNIASTHGGALCLSDRTSVSIAGDSIFFNNTAPAAGAIYVTDSSNISWTGGATFYQNAANNGSGGALYVESSSNVAWKSDSWFYANRATSSGGALVATTDCSATWTGVSHFINNSAEDSGGALYLWERSTAVWHNESWFRANSAYNGGVLVAQIDCSASWTAESHFLNNSADDKAGALYFWERSTAVWNAVSHFFSNKAGNGGVLVASTNCSVIWTAESFFVNNSAGRNGGGLNLWGKSTANFTAASHFIDNRADNGGALYLWSGCIATWNTGSDTPIYSHNESDWVSHVLSGSNSAWIPISTFSGNSAQFNGGAVLAGKNGILTWISNALFIDNNANNGGALFVTVGTSAEWVGEVNFTSNYAHSDGGAVGSMSLDSQVSSSDLNNSYSDDGLTIVVNGEDSVVTISGPTRFFNNTCNGKGGGMALVQSLVVNFNRKNITFSENSAGVSGGAVYIEGIGSGTKFENVSFVGNVAQIGGAVHATGSGTTVTIDEEGKQILNPTTFEGCKFIDNFAFTMGGAIFSASGQDYFLDTLFEGNQAKVGGALRLAGSVSIKNCSFFDNISDLDGGPAVFNIGYMPSFTRNTFRGNVFNCDPETFLNFNKSDDHFGTVCTGCFGECPECSFGEKGSPTCTSLIDAGIEHATSSGGNTTLARLIVDKGFWRATNNSTQIYECFNTDACVGGVTGSSYYCLNGYEGPYCSICAEGYVSGLSLSCRKCSDPAVGIAIAVVLTMLALAIGLVIILYLVSTEGAGPRRGIVHRVMKRIPMQSMKIIIVVWQILTQFASVANVTFPNVYQTFLDGVDFINFDLTWVFSAGCFFEVDFHDRLLWITISPALAMGALGATYIVTMRKTQIMMETTVKDVRQKHVSVALLITFLVYSSVSAVLFQMFACEELDDDKWYLRADYSIECDSSKHIALQTYAGFMILLYPIGIPALYASLLFSNRHALRDKEGREESLAVRAISGLWKPYKPQRLYFEVIECGRRVFLAGVVVFIYPNTAGQIAVTLTIAAAFMLVAEAMAPFQSQWDAWISRTGHVIIFISMYVALLLRVDVSDENASSQKTFEVILVAAHGCMILAVLVEAIMMALSLRTKKQVADPLPRIRPLSTLSQRAPGLL